MDELVDPSIQVTIVIFPDGLKKIEILATDPEKIEKMVDRAMADPNQRNEHVYRMIAIFAGIAFLAALLALTVLLPDPTKFQQRVLLSVLAIAAGGFAAALTGILDVKATVGKQLKIGATGALAVFVILLLIDPS